MAGYYFRKLFYVGCSTFIALLLAACSLEDRASIAARYNAETKYKEQELVGITATTDGYKDEKINDQTYKIQAKGNAVTRPERVRDIALLRAAKLGTEQGFDRLVIQETNGTLGCVQGVGFYIVELTVRYGNEGAIAGVGTVRSIPTMIKQLEESLNRTAYDARHKEKKYIANASACSIARARAESQRYGN